DGAFAAILRQREQALLVYPLPIALRDVRRIAQFAVKHRLLTIALSQAENIREGMLMSYGPNEADSYRRAGTFIDKILKGPTPAHSPSGQPTNSELAITRGTAEALNLPTPPSLLLRADQVIE